MPIVTTDLSNDSEPQPLDNGRYTARITEVKPYVKDSGKTSLGVTMEVINGATQKDGSDAEGRRLLHFFSTNGFESMKDGGKYSRGQLKSFLDAVGVDADAEPEDLIDGELDVVTRLKRDNDGILQPEIKHFRRVGE